MDAMNRTRLGGGVGGDKLADILFQFLAKLISLRRTDNRKRGLRGGGGGGRKSRAKKEGASFVEQVIDDGVSAGNKTTRGAQALSQSAHLKIDGGG